MNWLDIAILVVLVINILVGLKTGLIKAVLSLAGLILGIILAGRYYVPLVQRLTFIPQTKVAEIVAFALILIGTMVIAVLLATLLRSLVSAMMLGWVDHLGGAVFGLVLGTLFCGILLVAWAKFWGMNQAINSSSLAAILLDRFPAVLALLPDEFKAIRSLFQ